MVDVLCDTYFKAVHKNMILVAQHLFYKTAVFCSPF